MVDRIGNMRRRVVRAGSRTSSSKRPELELNLAMLVNGSNARCRRVRLCTLLGDAYDWVRTLDRGELLDSHRAQTARRPAKVV